MTYARAGLGVQLVDKCSASGTDFVGLHHQLTCYDGSHASSQRMSRHPNLATSANTSRCHQLFDFGEHVLAVTVYTGEKFNAALQETFVDLHPALVIAELLHSGRNNPHRAQKIYFIRDLHVSHPIGVPALYVDWATHRSSDPDHDFTIVWV